MRCLVSYLFLLGFTKEIFFVFSEDVDSDKTKQDDGRRNYTPNDLIQQLSKLADEQLSIQPRFRFPTRDFEDDSFYQSNLNTDEQMPNSQQNYYQTQQQYYQNPYFKFPNNDVRQEGIGSNGILDYQNQQNYYQEQQFNRPQSVRRPKKQKVNRYRPPFPVSQDPLDPYYQNYPPNGPYYPAGGNYPVPPNYPRPQIPPNIEQGQYPPYYPLQYPQQGGPNFGYPNQVDGAFGNFMDALNSIAKNDDQQCVPRLLCEVAAGGNPSYRQTSFLPSFLNTESLFTLLSALSGSVSPLLVFGRAALLGVTSQGRPSSCRYAYPECPRDPDRLVEYLNNHNGGFFRFFNGLGGQQNVNNQQLLGGLFNQQNYPQRPIDQNSILELLNQYNQQRPVNNGGQNNYFNRRPINYPGQSYPNPYLGLQSQRPNYDSLYNRGDPNYYRRYPVRYDYQQKMSLNENKSKEIEAEARILNNNLQAIPTNDNSHLTFVSYQNYKVPLHNDLDISLSYQSNRFTANIPNKNPEIKFPENPSINVIPNDDRYNTKTNLKFPGDSTGTSNFPYNRNPKAVFFPTSQLQDNNLYFPSPLPFYDHSKMIFPDRTGTGNLKFDSDKLTPSYRPDIINNNQNQYLFNRPNYFSGQFNSYDQQQDYYRAEPSKKKYVYIVRGNGDPHHPEIVEDVRARRAMDISSEDKDDVIRNNRDNKSSWMFPSPYQGVVYND